MIKAKQAKNDTLYKHAVRIQFRAIARAGELLSEIEAKSNANLKQNRQDGDGLSVETRTQYARNAGMSERQQKTALRVAAIPKPERDSLIDSVR